MDMRKKRLLQLRGRGLPNWGLAGKADGVTGAEHKHNKLVPPETKTWLQGKLNKVVITGRHSKVVISRVARWL